MRNCRRVMKAKAARRLALRGQLRPLKNTHIYIRFTKDGARWDRGDLNAPYYHVHGKWTYGKEFFTG